ncbi:MvdC/MvdD family ATP grasp protein [Nannocystis pusilla]|uniref:MvdC family ATP-grasp ribosomal peptide maturase n=1 Tax=Nannocystis pusilla TaxID=889268 RepID=A0ABS7TR89_9BACT|nr:MvdC family ATP-grasp ribosomal peptide maturase [Nannocystis pusilla]MBZ5710735.1 MvdC family ATP-grasp ribosomal peptide maturase [Nannocystis pusilla]
MNDPRDVVLLVTHSGDHYTIDRVAEELARRRVRPRRVDCDRFPTELSLTAALDVDPGAARRTLRDAHGSVDGDAVRAVWMRRLWPAALDPELDPELRDACRAESMAALLGFLDGLHDRRMVNRIDADRAAANKLRQLRIARRLGLRIPRTLVTNDPAEVVAFSERLGGRMVTKMLTPLTQSMSGRGPFVHTSIVRPEDLDDLEGLRHCPMVFQEHVPKAHELRVAVVATAGGGRCFAAAIDATGSDAGQVDWRKAAPDQAAWRRGSLPDDVAARLLELVVALGLVYGAVDLIVTPEGEHVFLEINPAGEWGMLERDAGLPIAAALADALLEE